MKRRFLALILAFILAAPGCLDSEPPAAAKKAGAAMNTGAGHVRTVADAVDKAGPVTDALADATGRDLSEATVSRLETVASRLEHGLSTASRAATVVSAAPGPQQPVAAGLAAILGAASTLAASVVAFAQRRKRKSAETHLATAVSAVDRARELVRARSVNEDDPVLTEHELLETIRSAARDAGQKREFDAAVRAARS